MTVQCRTYVGFQARLTQCDFNLQKPPPPANLVLSTLSNRTFEPSRFIPHSHIKVHTPAYPADGKPPSEANMSRAFSRVCVIRKESSLEHLRLQPGYRLQDTHTHTQAHTNAHKRTHIRTLPRMLNDQAMNPMLFMTIFIPF